MMGLVENKIYAILKKPLYLIGNTFCIYQIKGKEFFIIFSSYFLNTIYHSDVESALMFWI